MTAPVDFADAFARCPLIAILRGITPTESPLIGKVLIEAGFTLIEVPLNSPDPLESITRLAQIAGRNAVVGAGTVLSIADVAAVVHAGGRMVISPNTNTQVIQATVASGLVSLPGYATPTEAFTAIEAGAHGLKLFPAEAAYPQVVKAHRAVLPKSVPVLAVGGITPENMGFWYDAGVAGFGLGSALYKAGDPADTVKQNAQAFVARYRELKM